MAFWQNATASLVGAFSTAVLMLEESSELSHIHEVFIKPTSTICESEAAANQQQVTFNQVRIVSISGSSSQLVNIGGKSPKVKIKSD
jgi:hypothetical protein